MDQLVLLGKSLSDPARVRIIHVLLRSEACVCELVDALEASQSSVSTHLQVLRAAGVAKSVRKGPWIVYSLTPEAKSVLRALFKRYEPDRRMLRDVQRMERRLGLRVDDCCVLGAGQLKRGA